MKILLRSGIILLLLLFILVSGIFIFKNHLLDYFIKEVRQRALSGYNLSVNISEARLTGLKQIDLKGISFVPESGDTLACISSLYARFRLGSLLLGSVRLEELVADEVRISLVKNDSTDNFSFLWKRKRRTDDTVRTEPDYGNFLNKQIRNAFKKTPDRLQIKEVSIQLRDSLNHLKYSVSSLNVVKGSVQAEIKKGNDSLCGILEGSIEASRKTIQLKLYGHQKAFTLPYADIKWNAGISFDTLTLALKEGEYRRHILTVPGTARISNLRLDHRKLAPNEVIMRNCEGEFTFIAGKSSFVLDSSSVVRLNGISLLPFVKFTTYPKRQVSAKLIMPETPGQVFFESLPEGMFHSLEGLKVSGNLLYRMAFDMDFSMPDSLKFDSELQKRNFKIHQFGAEFFPKLNTSFTHTAFEKGTPVRTFTVGPDNPNFTPLYQISPYLKGAVLCSEDGGFYHHRGFNEEAFRKSIADNIKKGRFARGGSTISMQLVKNVFLNRSKTIGRKLEEILIVWLIEHNNLCGKDRMLEVYLNIIEWGPGIYGIREAADFYFLKHPADLNLAESIFLASIVPSPKSFKYSFEPGGYLKSRLYGYFKLVSYHMLKKGFISEDQHNNLFPHVDLRGPARNYILPYEEPPDDLFFH